MFTGCRSQHRSIGEQRGTIRLDHVQGHGQVRQQVPKRGCCEAVRETGGAEGQCIFGRELVRHR